MNFTHLFIEERYLEAIGWTLVHSIWQIALISMLLWVILAIVPKKASAWRYNIALSVLFLIFAAGCWTFIYQLESTESNHPLTYTVDVKMVNQASVISASASSLENISKNGS